VDSPGPPLLVPLGEAFGSHECSASPLNMNAHTRRTPSFLLALPLLVLSAFPACSKQGEGERCDAINAGNDDCASGLECVAAKQLHDKQADRCCPVGGGSSSNDLCRLEEGTGGTSGAGGSSGTGGSAGSDAGATKCQYTSQCLLLGQVCGPTGVCQPECAQNRDCKTGSCVDGVCSSTLGDASSDVSTGGTSGGGGTSGSGGSDGGPDGAGAEDSGGTAGDAG
jgi:hypothetical protein